MLHHISFAVSDLARSAQFYDAALSPLGYERVFSNDRTVGYGLPGGGDKFAIKVRSDAVNTPSAGFHLAFTAASPSAVDAFHRQAVAFGAVDQGAPGLRPHYGPSYYAAFVCDPDGYLIEAVHNGAA